MTKANMASLLILSLALAATNTLETVASEKNCSSNPCRHGGRCLDDNHNGTKCVCLPGWKGAHCERRRGSCDDPPAIPNGSVMTVRSFAVYNCKQGYKIIGIRMRQCIRGKWTGKVPTCQLGVVAEGQQTCERPPDINHGTFEPDDTLFPIGSTVKYVCDDKYRLSREVKLTCNEDGEWSSEKLPLCIKRKKCADPDVPENGFRVGSLFLEGTQVRFSCDDGYELLGHNTLQCVRSCLSCKTVRWSGKPPTCRELDPLERIASSLRYHFIDKLSWRTSDSLARAGLSSGAGGLDLVFVFDSSASVGKANFKKGIAFAKTIIDEFGVSKSKTGTRVAAVAFSSTARVIFNLKTNAMPSKEKGIRTLDNLNYEAKGTATSYALNKTIEDIVPETRGTSKKALFLITDGRSNEGGDPSLEAMILRDSCDFEIYAIGVTNSVDEEELRSIASEPFRTHVHLLEKFEDLTKLKQLITAKGNDYSECGVAGDTQLRNDEDLLIPGGHQAKAGAWPWLAAVYVKSNFRCGGVLVRQNWLLTGAHCLFHDGKVQPSDIVVRMGEHDRFKEEGTEQNIRAKKVFIHPNATATSVEDDLALIRLEHAVKFSPYVRTACLPQSTDVFYVRPGKLCVVAGWGSSQPVPSGNSARATLQVLHQIQIKFVSHQQCRVNASNPATITNKVICAGSSSGNRNACKGDRGTPIVVRRSDDRDSWVVVGLSRWGEGCATRGKYAVYTRIDRYMGWINNRINKRKAKNKKND